MKLIVAGQYFQFKNSYLPIRKPNIDKIKQTKAHNEHLFRDFGISTQKTTIKRDDNLSRTRNTFKLLAHANITQYSKFITLTTQKPLILEALRTHFHAWIRWLKTTLKENLRYVGVYEYQERGAPHIHLIFFNDAFIEWDKAHEKWKQIINDNGSLQIKQIKSHSIKMINYCVAYLGKQVVASFGQRSIIRSMGLKKPQVYHDEIPTSLKDKPLKVEYSRQMTSSQTDNLFENTFGYFNEKGDYKFEDMEKVGYVSALVSAYWKAKKETKEEDLPF